MGKIAFIGDSITKGTDYGGVTQADTFATKIGVACGYAAADVINAGVGGDTSAKALARLDADVIAHAPDVCVIMLGNNDCAGSSPLPVATFGANVTQVITKLKEAGIKPVLFSPGIERGATSIFLSYQPYLRETDKIAFEAGVPYLDIYRELTAAALYLDSEGFVALFDNALHLSVVGHQFVADFALRPNFSGAFNTPASEPEPPELVGLLADCVLHGVTAERLEAIGAARAAME